MIREIVTYGQVAYEAYCAKTGRKSLVSGASLPPWSDLPDAIRDAWMAAGNAVSDLIHGDGTAIMGAGTEHLAAELARQARIDGASPPEWQRLADLPPHPGGVA